MLRRVIWVKGVDSVSRAESYSAFREARLVISIIRRITLERLGLFKTHSLVLVMPLLIYGLLSEETVWMVSSMTFSTIDTVRSMLADCGLAFARLQRSAAWGKCYIILNRVELLASETALRGISIYVSRIPLLEAVAILLYLFKEDELPDEVSFTEEDDRLVIQALCCSSSMGVININNN